MFVYYNYIASYMSLHGFHFRSYISWLQRMTSCSLINIALLINIMIGVMVDVSRGDCRVLADCDSGEARWERLAVGQQGKPGKRVISLLHMMARSFDF